MKKISLFLLLGLYTQMLSAQTGHYSLFKPVPKDSLRKEMETDRPNVTESPYTVDAGHLQYETSLVSLERMRSEDGLESTLLLNYADIKLGLLPNTNLHIGVESYGRQTLFPPSGPAETQQGFGDLTLKLKQNLYGNYEGDFSIALMPYVIFPTGRYSGNSLYEMGIMLPVSVKLPDNWKLGVQLKADRLRNEMELGRHTELLESLVLSKTLFEKLEILGETYGSYDMQKHQWHNYIDAALEYALSNDVKIDLGMNHGLQHDAGDTYFVGLAFRY
ncbi:transporter [Mucilaginibacter sp. JRF]|uniref:transporter n=1 Tax=Mucilaginibacter sp. JRF TaxID=2780088 RepID=UPI00187EB438|nr:transporter [Mucilaginibacter sp. JRF]MBE9586462.1 transporter [Mucilaginibacter sp. JRF]